MSCASPENKLVRGQIKNKQNSQRVPCLSAAASGTALTAGHRAHTHSAESVTGHGVTAVAHTAALAAADSRTKQQR